MNCSPYPELGVGINRVGPKIGSGIYTGGVYVRGRVSARLVNQDGCTRQCSATYVCAHKFKKRNIFKYYTNNKSVLLC